MLRTMAIVALKGGSGKSTIATHLALAAHLRGVATLVVDTDPQRSTSEILGARTASGPDCTAASGARLLAMQIEAVKLRKDLLIIDTPAGVLEDVSEAIVLSDLAVMVVRPTLLDIAALARTVGIVRRLKKPSVVVVNQAPTARNGVEPPLMQRALRALDYMRLPVAPTIVRARSIYQTALETGRSAEEMGDPAAAKEVADLWAFVDAATVAMDEQPRA
jgi:chromosome partitioning protein